MNVSASLFVLSASLREEMGMGLYSFLPEERAEYGTGIINMGGHGHGGMVQQKNPVALPG